MSKLMKRCKGYYYGPPIRFFKNFDSRFKLRLADLASLPGFTVLKGFTNAQNNFEGSVKGSPGLLGDDFGRFVEQSSALGVA